LVGTWKVLDKGSPGSGTEFGANDTDKINKWLRGDLDVDTGALNSSWHVRDNKLQFRDPLNLFGYIVRTSGIAGNKDVTLPLLTANDTFVFNDFPATLAQKILAAARVSNYVDVESTSTPANPGVNVLRVYRRTSDNALVYRTNAGVETVLGGAAGGGEINTASNIGTAGQNVFKSKVGFDLQFRKINGISGTGGLITVVEDTPNNKLDVKLTPSGTNDRYIKTNSSGVVDWARPARVMPDDSLYDGKRWGSFMGSAVDGDGLFSNLYVEGNTSMSGGTSLNRTNILSDATNLALGGWSTWHRVCRGVQNPKFKGRFNANIATERMHFGFHSDETWPGGADPLLNKTGLTIGYNEGDANFMVEWNNGAASNQSVSTGVAKDASLHTFEVMLHTTPAVSAWFDGNLIVNASTTTPPANTTSVSCHNWGQCVGTDATGPTVEWAMLYFDPRL